MWHRSSFQQLSRIQTRQVGCLVGVALYDNIIGGQAPSERGYSCHSMLYQLSFLPSLRSIAGNEGILNFQEFLADRRATAYQIYKCELDEKTLCEKDSFYHLIAASIPLVVSYPYISTGELNGNGVESRLKIMECQLSASLSSKSRNKIFDWTHALQHILLRYLCECKSPIQNTAREGICSSEISTVLESLSHDVLCTAEDIIPYFRSLADEDACDISTIGAMALRIFNLISQDTHCLKTGLKKLTSLHNVLVSNEVRLSNRLNEFINFASIYSASLLGSKFSSKNIPFDVLEQAPDADLICSLALNMVQFSWNPNYVRAGVLPQS